VGDNNQKISVASAGDTGDKLGLVATTVNPAYVHATPDGKFLFATNWQTAAAEKADTVSAYAIDARTGALTPLNKASAGGGLPNQVVVDPRGTIAAVTNYGFRTTDPDRNNSSFAALKIGPDGTLDDPLYVDHHVGPALSPRQTSGAHTHGVVFTKDDRFAFVGLSKIRETSTFGGMPIAERRPALKCGVGVVDLICGRLVAHLEQIAQRIEVAERLRHLLRFDM